MKKKGYNPKYKLLQIRMEDYEKFAVVRNELKELNKKMYSVELFKLMLNFWIFHNEEDLKKSLEEVRRIRENEDLDKIE